MKLYSQNCSYFVPPRHPPETRGDIRYIIYGHLIRLAVWDLRHDWDKATSTSDKIVLIASKIEELGGLCAVEDALSEGMMQTALVRSSTIKTESRIYAATDDDVIFTALTDCKYSDSLTEEQTLIRA